jgi:hypothetical protein
VTGYLALELPLVGFKIFARERYVSWRSGDRSLVLIKVITMKASCDYRGVL